MVEMYYKEELFDKCLDLFFITQEDIYSHTNNEFEYDDKEII